MVHQSSRSSYCRPAHLVPTQQRSNRCGSVNRFDLVTLVVVATLASSSPNAASSSRWAARSAADIGRVVRFAVRSASTTALPLESQDSLSAEPQRVCVQRPLLTSQYLSFHMDPAEFAWRRHDLQPGLFFTRCCCGLAFADHGNLFTRS